MCIRDRIEEVETTITTTEPAQDKEIEPRVGDKKETTGDPNLMKFIEQMNERFIRRMEKKFDSMREEMNENFRKLSGKMDMGFTQLNETLNSTSGGSNEKIKSKEDTSILSSQNKNKTNKENIQTMEMETKKIYQRKLINTREELEMMKNGPVSYTHLDVYKRQELNIKLNEKQNIRTK